ncbi:MAG: hypothetical protein F4X92_05325, partial [Gammaproteobacteria bacterium]|nr:hypothetical protein [Gammaproteobacteria bacterium]
MTGPACGRLFRLASGKFKTSVIMNVKRKIDRHLLGQVTDIAISAGREILNVYDNPDLSVNYKQDGSPLTLADLRSHEIIQAALEKITPDIPI